jgi:RNA polymerase sigma-70 factor (ECF subfamily)
LAFTGMLAHPFRDDRGAQVSDEITTVGACISISTLAQLSDHELVSGAKRGESAAIGALMRRYNRRLFRVARSILRNDAAAEDAVQECYMRAFMNLHRYEPTGTFGAWLTRIAINEALMLKRRTRRTLLPLEDFDSEPAAADENDALTTPDSLQAASARQLLELAIDSLPRDFRTVFMLRVVEQLSVAETAASLGINEATVKTRLHRAKARLRENISRRLRREHLTLFEFGGATCDRIVAHVLARLRGGCEIACSTPT